MLRRLALFAVLLHSLIACKEGEISGNNGGKTNYRPTLVDDTAATLPVTAVDIDVLANDSDADGDTLSITAVDSPANGTAEISGTMVRYTPGAGFLGDESFIYTASDGKGGTATASVTITVNTPPIAVDDDLLTQLDVPATVQPLANDTDADGDILSLTILTQPANGAVVVDTTVVTDLVYTPAVGWAGTASFTYQVSDTRGATAEATVNIRVNTPPIAIDDSVGTGMNTAEMISVLDNDTDADGNTLVVVAVTQGTSGVVTNDGTTVTYTPNTDSFGVDSFTYDIDDGFGGGDTATVSIAVTGPPVATDDADSTVINTAVRISVLDNDLHPDGLSFSLSVVGTPTNGTAVIDFDGIIYSPSGGYVGPDSFTYTIQDTAGSTATATVFVLVRTAVLGQDIAAGGNQSFAISTGGSLLGWGTANNVLYGSATPAALGSATDWTDVEAGRNHACALDANQALWCWNDDFYGQLGLGSIGDQSAPTRVGLDSDWSNFGVGASHTCGIRNGELYCWGYNQSGQLGIGVSGSTGKRDVPTRVGTGVTWDAVAPGGGHTCGLQAGALYCWGDSGSGKLGDPAISSDIDTPALIGTDSTWAAVVAAGNHTCGLKANGSLWCWGRATTNGTGATATTPARVGSSTGWTDISAMGDVSCGVDGGTIRCWGTNTWGQIGDGTQIDRSTPSQVGAQTDWARVAVGREHACGMKSDGRVYCWGRRGNGQLGDGITPQALAPNRVGVDLDWDSVTGGGDVFWNAFGCAVKTDGTMWCWGDLNRSIFSGEKPARLPTQRGSATTWASVDGGDTHACGLQTNQSLWCWGSGSQGKLGQGSTADLVAPARVGGTDLYLAVAAGGDHTCAVRGDNTLWCWGRNSAGQLGTGDNTASNVPVQAGTDTDWATVAAGANHTCGLKTNDSLWCWGAGTTNAPVQVETDTDWRQVSAGGTRVCATRIGNTLWCWTNASMTPAQVGTNTDWSLVSARGDNHACGIRTDNSLWCFGDNGQGQLGDGTTTDHALPQQVGSDTDWAGVVTAAEGNWSAFTCAVKSDGTLWCWGNNIWGQLGDGNAWSPTPVQSSI